MTDEILSGLAKNQRKDVSTSKKLQYTDLKRIAKNLDTSIFDDECSIWKGYITNAKNISKGVYINFYFRGKKYALHRLLYNNFIGELNDDEYIKFSCINKGKCCNVHHLVKYRYVDNYDIYDNVDVINNYDNIQQNVGVDNIDNSIEKNDTEFIVNFE